MPKTERRLPIARNSPRKLPRGAKRSTVPVRLAGRAEVTVVVRSRGSREEWDRLVAEITATPPRARRYPERAQLLRRWSAAEDDLDAVKRFAAAHGLRTKSADALRRCVVLSGTLRQLGRAFGVEFQSIDHPLGRFRTHRASPRVPASVSSVIECVLGLDNLPVAHHHAGARARVAQGMDRDALLRVYQVPKRLTGRGQTIALIELGGGVHRRDYDRYFRQLKLEPPLLRLQRIGSAKNDPAPAAAIRKYMDVLKTSHFQPCVPVSITGNPALDGQIGWTLETTMDVEIAGTIAPGASLLLVQTSNDEQGQYHAITSVLADTKSAPSVISCSWGAPESQHAGASMHAIDRWFQAAALLGVTVCVGTGDSGDGTMCDKPGQMRFTASFPATSPHAMACGGTTLDAGTGHETAWNQNMPSGAHMAGGGGFSDVFPLPPWQREIDPDHWLPRAAASGRGRAIPDVAAKADLDAAFSVIVGGIEVDSGGTSAVAPLWAGIVALLNEKLKFRAGSFHALFYEGLLRDGVHDIVEGDTGHFHAGPGWDPCTGWGSPRTESLLRALRRTSA